MLFRRGRIEQPCRQIGFAGTCKPCIYRISQCFAVRRPAQNSHRKRCNQRSSLVPLIKGFGCLTRVPPFSLELVDKPIVANVAIHKANERLREFPKVFRPVCAHQGNLRLGRFETQHIARETPGDFVSCERNRTQRALYGVRSKKSLGQTCSTRSRACMVKQSLEFARRQWPA